MMRKIREGLRNEEGFTLVELMVVVLIIAILMAIAIPTFLGAREKAQDRAAQSDLRNALTAAKVFYVDGETYLDTDNATTAASYGALEPSISFVAGSPAAGAYTVGVTATANSILLMRESASGTWFCISDDTTGASRTSGNQGTRYGSGAAAGNVDSLDECDNAAW